MNTGEYKPRRILIIIAFAAVYLIWGSTYLAIRFAVETLPPFLMGGSRFLISGLILYGCLRARGIRTPAKINWGRAAVAGALLLGLGNGGVNWAEQKVPSGLTALIIAGTPVWFALFDWLRPGGARPAPQIAIGISVGFIGVTLLVGSRSAFVDGNIDVAGVASLMVASVAWALGSLYAKYSPTSEAPIMAAAQQMISGGLILLLSGLLMGERVEWSHISPRSIAAFTYLTLVGSLVGFTAYAWLLKATTPARVSTYAYVNPVIAVFLGWAIGGETLSGRMLVAAAVIVLGVIIIASRRPWRGRTGPSRKTETSDELAAMGKRRET